MQQMILVAGPHWIGRGFDREVKHFTDFFDLSLS